jgi:prefoldin subunit 5
MQAPTPAPPAPVIPPVPPVPAIPGIPGQEFVVFPGGDGASAQAVYQALKAQRRELGNQLENLEERRSELSQRLEQPGVGGADRKGLEGRITEVDQRISAIDKQIAESEAQIARQAAVPGAAVEPRQPRREGPPEEVFILGGIFIFVVLLPLSIALARRVWRRGVATITKLPAELTERLSRLEQGVDAVAVEVERIGEGQRYMARLMGDDPSLRAIGAGAAEPVEVKAREADAHYRR